MLEGIGMLPPHPHTKTHYLCRFDRLLALTEDKRPNRTAVNMMVSMHASMLRVVVISCLVAEQREFPLGA